MQPFIPGMGEKDTEKEDLFAGSHSLRAKYFALRKKAGEIENRDFAFKQMRDVIIYQARYDFDPETFMADRKIAKGQILQKLRENSIHS
ncbi:MAG: hypothetical protein ACO24H_03425 [Polynucleobacter sp.]